MECKPPSWLTKDYIKTALENGKNYSNILSIENMEIDSPVAKGDNYACSIYRVKAEYRVKTKKDLQKISLIVKAPNVGGISDSMSKMGIFNKEVMIYNELIPKYKSVYGEKWQDITAKSFYSTQKEVIILEDLKANGYVMADRMKRLDFEECIVALTNLAKFHAASVKLYETEPDLIKKMGKEVVFHPDFKEVDGFIKGGFFRLADEIKNQDNLKKYTNNLRKCGEVIFDNLTKLTKPVDDEFNVLNHGDYWVNNMMFKYVDNKVIDVKPLDLQLARYASPAFDLIYFIDGSVQEDVKTERYEQLLNIYLQKLNENLKIFGSEKRLQMTELKKAIEERQLFNVYVAISILPLIVADPKNCEILDINDLDVENVKNTENLLETYYKNPSYIQLITKRLEEFEKKGWFIKGHQNSELENQSLSRVGNSSTITKPVWLTKEFVKTALEDGDVTLLNSITVKNIEIDMPVAKGNNYICCIHRVKAEYQVNNENAIKNISLIVKSPYSGGLYEFYSKMGIFNKEVMIYKELIPKYKSVFMDKWPDLTVKTYYSSQKEVIIMEDLKSTGYVLADRKKQLNFDESIVALSNLAKFHAASVKLYESEPDFIKKVGQEVLFHPELKDDFNRFIISSIECFSNEMKKHEKLIKYEESLKKIGETLYDRLCEIFKPKEGDFNVLNHGDYWTTNMMFKYINNKPVKIKMLDLQASRYASPALDLIYFINGSVQDDIITEKYDELLNKYLEELNENLKLYDSKKQLRLTELKKAIEEREIFNVYVTIASLPLFLFNYDNDNEFIDFKEMDLKEMTELNDIITPLYNNPKLIKLITKRFQEFEKKRWFVNN